MFPQQIARYHRRLISAGVLIYGDQERLAAALGLSGSQVSRYESGASPVPELVVGFLERALQSLPIHSAARPGR